MPMAIAALPGFIAGLTIAEIAMVASLALTIGTTVFGAVQQRERQDRVGIQYPIR